jgi:hypothetical protein
MLQAAMEPHRLAEERSLAYHQAIAQRLLRDPRILDEARRVVESWLQDTSSTTYYAEAWRAVLAGDAATVAAFITDPGERARELRQSTPFAGVLSPRERWAIWDAVREMRTRA